MQRQTILGASCIVVIDIDVTCRPGAFDSDGCCGRRDDRRAKSRDVVPGHLYRWQVMLGDGGLLPRDYFEISL